MQHDEPEFDRRREQDDRDDDPGDDRAREPREDVEDAADAHRVGGDGVDDVARRDRGGTRRAGRRRVAADDLDRPVGRRSSSW